MWPLFLRAGLASAFFGGMFEHMVNQNNQNFGQQQHQQDDINNLVENTYKTFDCDGFLCEDTLTCVKNPNECPCVFPDSEIKCLFPNKNGYVCISKPTNDKGIDCEYVINAFI